MPDYRWRERIIGWALAALVVISLLGYIFKLLFL